MATCTKKAQTVNLFVLSIHKDGRRRLWPEALPAKTAFAAARELAKDGFTCKVIKLELTRDQLKETKGKKVFTIHPQPFEALRKELDGAE